MILSSATSELLAEKGWALLDLFPPSVLLSLSLRVEEMEKEQVFTRAGTGRVGDRLHPELRTDKTRWLDEGEAHPLEGMVFERLRALQSEINRTLYLGVKRFESLYAIYEPGAYYVKHRDAFSVSPSRRVSLVTYLNPEWRDGLGGELKIYNRENPDKVDAEIIPRLGTTVCFLSEEIFHEVLPASRPRKSLVTWFRNDI